MSSLHLTKFVEFLLDNLFDILTILVTTALSRCITTKPPKPTTFQLHKEDDDQWFGYFKRQYKSLWVSCRQETLPRSG